MKTKKTNIILAVKVIIIAIFLAFFYSCSLLVCELGALPKVNNNSFYFFDNYSQVYSTYGNSLLSDIYYPQHDNMNINEELNQNIVDCLVCNEDKNFYNHNGFVPAAFVRAAISCITGRGTQGGSTITMQACKNTLLGLTSSKITIFRKFSEIYLAINLERAYSKEDILHIYLNNADYSNGIYGISTASRYYFNKSQRDLTLSEAAFLTAIPQYPGNRNPLTNYDNAIQGRNVILKSMLKDNYISEEEYEKAIAEKVVLHVVKLIVDNEDTTFKLDNEILYSDNDTQILRAPGLFLNEHQNIYISIPDIKNIFDKDLYYDNSINSYVIYGPQHTCLMNNETNKITIDKKQCEYGAITCNNIKYLPFKIFQDVYESQANMKADDNGIYDLTINTNYFSNISGNLNPENKKIIGNNNTDTSKNIIDSDEVKDYYSNNKEINMPVFFYYTNSELKSINDESFSFVVASNHLNNIEVWPVVKSQFESIDEMEEFGRTLLDYNSRTKIADSITQYCVKYNFDGITLEFSNLSKVDKDYFTKFAIDLNAKLKMSGKKLTICVPSPDGPPNTSQCYDRATLAKIADYLCLTSDGETYVDTDLLYSNCEYE